MTEQQTAPEADATAAVDADEPEAAAIDVSEIDSAEADAEAAATTDDADAAAGDDEEPQRDPDAQAAVDEVMSHTTKLAESSGDPVFRTPPGIPAGADPGIAADRRRG